MITHEAKLFAQNGLEVPEIFLSSPSHLRIDEHRGFAYFTQSHDKLSALIRQFNGAQRGTYEDQFHITFAMLAALCFTNSGIGQAQTKDRARLIEDAKKEDKVMVYVSSKASDARALEAAFEKKYPFVNMEF